jgi:hypothetical protein
MNARRSMTRALAADAVAFSEHSGWSDGSASAPGWSASAANLRARGAAPYWDLTFAGKRSNFLALAE